LRRNRYRNYGRVHLCEVMVIIIEMTFPSFARGYRYWTVNFQRYVTARWSDNKNNFINLKKEKNKLNIYVVLITTMKNLNDSRLDDGEQNAVKCNFRVLVSWISPWYTAEMHPVLCQKFNIFPREVFWVSCCGTWPLWIYTINSDYQCCN